MIINERDSRKEYIITAAQQIMTAARTSPKTKGHDNMEIALVIGEDIELLASAMHKEAERTGMKFLIRDAANITVSDAVILVGTKNQSHGLNCGYCGYATCQKKDENDLAACALNHVDVGIALGSMCSTAMDLKIDTRVMFSAGLAAMSIDLMPQCHSLYALPLSIGSKSPFFDRK